VLKISVFANKLILWLIANVKSIRAGVTLSVGIIVLKLIIKLLAIVAHLNINSIQVQAFAIKLTYVIRMKSEENNAIIKELIV
jgi:hypothetical protein